VTGSFVEVEFEVEEDSLVRSITLSPFACATAVSFVDVEFPFVKTPSVCGLMDIFAVSLGRRSSAKATGSYNSLSCGHTFTTYQIQCNENISGIPNGYYRFHLEGHQYQDHPPNPSI
jgi:hypothetical protein